MDNDKRKTRREFLRDALRGASLVAMGGLVGLGWSRGRNDTHVWQIDPAKCNYCGSCATACVLEESAVKCVQLYPMCGYCDLCTGYFDPNPKELDTGAENQLCPTGAIERKFIEEPYFEFNIDEKLCIGCGKCVVGCAAFGNGSLFLQVRHDRCLNCNECAIAKACPADAFVRVPADKPYLLKDRS